MTNKFSPPDALKKQADNIAQMLKAAEAGHLCRSQIKNKMIEARKKPTIDFGVVMDDKVMTIAMSWELIRDTSAEGISEWIVGQMQERKLQ